MIKTYYNLFVRFIRTDEEKTLRDRYVKLTYKYDIIIECSITNTSKQNNVTKRSREVIIKKARYLRIVINLPTSL